MNQSLILIFGLLLGIRHAFEADHIIAVSTIITQQKSSLKAALIGTFWGIGHTVTLFVIGIIVILARVSIPSKLSNIMEVGVGIMLIALGIKSLIQGTLLIHQHRHSHNGIVHKHPHAHVNLLHTHHKSFLIGSVHGLAGSGALMLLVLSTINSTIQGLYYIVIFGIGSIIGMTITSFFLGLPFIYWVDKFPNIEKYIRVIVGIVSILFGLIIIYNLLRY